MNREVMLRVVCCFFVLGLICMYVPRVNGAKFNMSYLYGSYDYISLVERTNGALDEVSPSYFDLNKDGSLSLNVVDTNFVNAMHQKGITVVPFLSNHWDREKGRNALKNKEILVNQIVNAVKKYNLDGVNVDLENLTEADRNEYTNLVKLLKERLPSGKTVAVAVAANPYGWTSGWQWSYDYSKLAKYSDYLMLMAYDEHYEGGASGAVAGIEFVEQSIQYALKYVNSEKIVLGIPFYGRYWKNGSSYGGYGVTINRIEKLVSKYTSKVVYDTNAEAVKATITIKNGEICPVINGKALSAGTYTFWYENEQSLTKKLELISKYNLKGSGSWSLGQEDAGTWSYYKNVVNGDTDAFYDVSESYWARDEIYYARDNGWVEGKSENKFEPEIGLTRAEFATMLCRILGYSTDSNTNTYIDVNGHWAKGAISAVSKAGLMNGYSDGSFMPDKEITREEVVKVLYYLSSDSKLFEGKSFSDVESSRWSYKFIEKMSGLGIINGYQDGSFKPENVIKRSEMVVILKRMFA